MPGLSLETDAIVLLRRPAADAFQQFTVFSVSHGSLLCLKRVAGKAAAGSAALDLFDEVHLFLESSNQGHTWFIKEARLLQRHAAIGRHYDALAAASRFTTLIARNAVAEESRAPVYALLRQALGAFGGDAAPELVFFKSLYCFARDEGYPVKQDWAKGLPPTLRTAAARLLNTPLAELTADDAPAAGTLLKRLETWLRGETEILLD